MRGQQQLTAHHEPSGLAVNWRAKRLFKYAWWFGCSVVGALCLCELASRTGITALHTHEVRIAAIGSGQAREMVTVRREWPRLSGLDKDVLDGPCRTWDERGALKGEGEYRDDLKSGTWRWFDAMGQVTKEEVYDRGVLVENPK